MNDEEQASEIGDAIMERLQTFAAADETVLEAYLGTYTADLEAIIGEMAWTERCIAMVREEQERRKGTKKGMSGWR